MNYTQILLDTNSWIFRLTTSDDAYRCIDDSAGTLLPIVSEQIRIEAQRSLPHYLTATFYNTIQSSQPYY